MAYAFKGIEEHSTFSTEKSYTHDLATMENVRKSNNFGLVLINLKRFKTCTMEEIMDSLTNDGTRDLIKLIKYIYRVNTYQIKTCQSFKIINLII